MIYAILAEQNIAKLFAAALCRAYSRAIGYMVAIAIFVRVSPGRHASVERMPRGRALARAARVWPVAAIFVVVFGGIYGGLFTPTEGAAVGAAATGGVAWRDRWSGGATPLRVGGGRARAPR